jgi:transcriptional antiterminator RfaH
VLSTIADTLMWYVVHTHPKQEDRTTSNLQVLGIETVSPKLRVRRYNEFTGQLIRAVRPLFPSYIFARFKFNQSYHRVRFTKGAHSLVSFNNGPAPVDGEVVELIRARIGNDGLVKMDEELKPGDEVVINEGRFKNFCGIFEREMEDADRISILLDTVSFQPHVVVDKVLVNKLPPDKRSRVA